VERSIVFRERVLVLLIAIAYVFAVVVRLYWVYWASGFEDFYWNGSLMINNNDGYFFASGVQKFLYDMHQFNPRVPEFTDRGLVFVTSLLATVLPFSLDQITLYMPAVFSSLIVVPIILLGRLYGSLQVGFFASLIASVAWSYYNRSMIGYYDTDMFSVSVLMFIFYFLAASIETKERKYVFWAALLFVIYPFLYLPGRNLLYVLAIFYLCFMALFFRRESLFLPALNMIFLALLPVWGILKFVFVIGYYILEKRGLTKDYDRYLFYILIAIFVLFSGFAFAVWQKIDSYLFKEGTIEEGLKFYKVMQTIREASGIDFVTLANRISGHSAVFLVSLIGYILLLFKRRSFWLSLVFVGLGLFAVKGGLRFTIYAVPFLAFSFVYLFWYLSARFAPRATFAVTAATAALALVPNIVHVINYKVPTVMLKPEVADLVQIKKEGEPKDYIIAWWDYGYPIWYYADKNTLIDGGKHNHDNFIVSKIFTTDSPALAASLARVSVETYIQQCLWYKRFSNDEVEIEAVPKKFLIETAKGYAVASPGYPVIDLILNNKKNNQIDPDIFLEELRLGVAQIPRKSVEIYLYMPLRMLEIFPTIARFSNIDLKSGKLLKSGFLYYADMFKDTKEFIFFPNKIAIDKKKGEIVIENQRVPIKEFMTLGYDSEGKVVKEIQRLRDKAPLSVIFLKEYQAFLILDEKMRRSMYVRMFVFDDYDPEFFEPVVISPWSKIYRVKI